MQPSLFDNYSVVALPKGRAYDLVDAVSNRTGDHGATALNQIPGAYILPQIADPGGGGTTLIYAPGAPYTIEYQATQGDPIEAAVFADGAALEIEMRPHPSTTAAIVQATNTISIGAGLDEAIILHPELVSDMEVRVIDEQAAASYTAIVTGTVRDGVQPLAVRFENQRVSLTSQDAIVSYQVQLEAAGVEKEVFVSTPLSLQPQQTHTIHIAPSGTDSTGVLVLEVDQGSDGTVDETIVLGNMVYLPLLRAKRLFEKSVCHRI